jgi:hypothetical protein
VGAARKQAAEAEAEVKTLKASIVSLMHEHESSLSAANTELARAQQDTAAEAERVELALSDRVNDALACAAQSTKEEAAALLAAAQSGFEVRLATKMKQLQQSHEEGDEAAAQRLVGLEKELDAARQECVVAKEEAAEAVAAAITSATSAAKAADRIKAEEAAAVAAANAQAVAAAEKSQKEATDRAVKAEEKAVQAEEKAALARSGVASAAAQAASALKQEQQSSHRALVLEEEVRALKKAVAEAEAFKRLEAEKAKDAEQEAASTLEVAEEVEGRAMAVQAELASAKKEVCCYSVKI